MDRGTLGLAYAGCASLALAAHLLVSCPALPALSPHALHYAFGAVGVLLLPLSPAAGALLLLLTAHSLRHAAHLRRVRAALAVLGACAAGAQGGRAGAGALLCAAAAEACAGARGGREGYVEIPRGGARRVPPRLGDCSALSLLYFHWVQPLVEVGKARTVEGEDIPELEEEMTSRHVLQERFGPTWEREVEGGVRLVGGGGGGVGRASLWRALARTFAPALLMGGSLKALNDVCVFMSPVLLQRIILHLQDASAHPGREGNVSGGLVLAGALFVVYTAQSLCFNHYFGHMVCIQSHVSGALISVVYAKSARLSTSHLVGFSKGFVQNLMAVDSRALSELTLYINTVWSGVAQIVIALALLHNLLGLLPTAAGVLLMALCIPAQARILAALRTSRERASACTDQRVKVVGEALYGISVVKYMSWEKALVEKILGRRVDELRQIRISLVVQALNSTLVTSIPMTLSLVTIGMYAGLGGKLDAAVIFPAIALFNILRPQLLLLPNVLVSITRSMAAAARIENFLLAPELPPRGAAAYQVPGDDFAASGCDVIARRAAVAWVPEDGVTLRGIDLALPQGCLAVCVGATAAGKSTLLAGVLGEMSVTEGSIGVRPGAALSFCAQEPYVRSATLRDNVLFGAEMDEQRYRTALRVSCLLPDLLVLPGGDLTEIGGRGVNLSGGQKARVALARAVYNAGDVCLMDEPLAAVDAGVARAIWEDCIVGYLKGRTRLIATNNLHFASSASVEYVAVVDHGVCLEFGKREDLVADKNSAFSGLLATYEASGSGESPEASGSEGDGGLEEGGKTKKEDNGEARAEMESRDDERGIIMGSDVAPKSAAAIEDHGRLVQQEGKSVGRVALRHYVRYIKAWGGYNIAAFLVMAFACMQLCNVGSSLVLSAWSESSRLAGYPNIGSVDPWFLTVYVGACLGGVVWVGIGNFALSFASLRASVAMHEDLCDGVFSAPLSFFQSTPSGRILNRFNSSMDKIDNGLASTFMSTIRLAISVSASCLLILYATPAFALVLLPVTLSYLWIQDYYRQTAVDVRRLESVSRSPLYSHFEETLDGLPTLRAFAVTPAATAQNFALTNTYLATAYASQATIRWLSTRLELLAALMTTSAAVLAVLAYDRVSPELSGVTLSYSMQMVGWLSWSVRQATETESQMSSVEQVSEYCTPPHPREEPLPPPPPTHDLATPAFLRTLHAARAPTSWPSAGAISLANVTMRYRPELPPALSDVSLDIAPGQRVGICGRTGSGKSSLVSTLFRMQPLAAGTIAIDGVDIATLPLATLRSALAVIAQDPILFSGTVRSNLDMAGAHDDASVLRALRNCGVLHTMTTPLTLDSEITENGANLSAGQRQLLCLGRVLLKHARVLVLDEATSAMDDETDRRLGETLARELPHATTLIVAHRLHTIMQCDRIAVLHAGRVAEYGPPAALLADPSSRLARLAHEAGPAAAAHLTALAAAAAPKDPLVAAHDTLADAIAAWDAPQRDAPDAEEVKHALRRMVSSLSALAARTLGPADEAGQPSAPPSGRVDADAALARPPRAV